MVTSVKLSERGKRLLDALQAETTLKVGEKISQQELLELALEEAERMKSALIERISKRPRVPLSEEEIEQILRTPRDWGVVTSEEQIDKYLYGGG